MFKIVLIVGPTASGKSGLAMALANNFCVEIVNGDSRQFYREMNIGTAKPSAEARRRVPHHLIDLASIDDTLTVADFVRVADAAIADISSRGGLPVIVSGTGLYVRALLYGIDDIPPIEESIRFDLCTSLKEKGLGSLRERLATLDPEAAQRLEPNDAQRTLRALEVVVQTGRKISEFWHEKKTPRYDFLKIGLKTDRVKLYEKINCRVDEMMGHGLREEAKQLWQSQPKNKLLAKTIGYAEWAKFGFEDTPIVMRAIKQSSRQFAKRQITWFGRENDIEWFSHTDIDAVTMRVRSWLAGDSGLSTDC